MDAEEANLELRFPSLPNAISSSSVAAQNCKWLDAIAPITRSTKEKRDESRPVETLSTSLSLAGIYQSQPPSSTGIQKFPES